MPARDAAVSPVGVETVGKAGAALRGDVDGVCGHSRAAQRRRDGTGEIERGLPRRVGPQVLRSEELGHLGSDGKAARVEAGPNGSAKRARIVAQASELLHSRGRNPGGGTAPPGVKQRACHSAGRDDGHRRAIGCGDRDPGIAGAKEEAVRGARGLGGEEDAPPVLLVDAERLAPLKPERGPYSRAVLLNVLVRVAHGEPDVERGVGALAHTAEAGCHAEPDPGGQRVRGRTPEHGAIRGEIRNRHGRQGDRSRAPVQAIYVVLATGALALAAGCAHAPAPVGGAEMRSRLLGRADAAGAPARGQGVISLVREGRRAGSADIRWVSVAESIAVIASVGPMRVMQGSLRGDSVAMALRHSDLGVTGALEPAGFGDAKIARFLLEPWRFGGPAMRDPILRAAIEQVEKGYRLHGRLVPGDSSRRFELLLSTGGEARALTLVLGRNARGTLHVRYGKPRTFAAGILPRWIEWSWGRSRARLDVETHTAVDPARVRLAFRAEPGDTLLALDDPRGRALLRRLFGLVEEKRP